MSHENVLWGAPKIHGELLKLGIDIGEASVSKYMVRRRRPPSQRWRTFLDNHVKNMVSVDFFTVPTLRFQILYVFLVLAHDRRRIVHFAVTAHPTAEWTAQQMREAFPWESAPRYLLRDRDRIFGKDFVDQVKAMGIQQVLSAPRSPWQRAYVERVIGTIRRECLDHMIVFNERCLYRHLKSFTDYYHRSRTHLALDKDSPELRPIQPPDAGRIIAIPEVSGLHHRYERRAPEQTTTFRITCRSALISKRVVGICTGAVQSRLRPVFMLVRRSRSKKYPAASPFSLTFVGQFRC
jgi:hypothetical protein